MGGNIPIQVAFGSLHGECCSNDLSDRKTCFEMDEVTSQGVEIENNDTAKVLTYMNTRSASLIAPSQRWPRRIIGLGAQGCHSLLSRGARRLPGRWTHRGYFGKLCDDSPMHDLSRARRQNFSVIHSCISATATLMIKNARSDLGKPIHLQCHNTQTKACSHELRAVVVEPSICTAEKPVSRLSIKSREDILEYRALNLTTWTRSDKAVPIVATMDTGADCNAITLGKAKQLGFDCEVDRGGGLSINGVGGNRFTSLGTMSLSFKLPCDPGRRVPEEFHVVRDDELAGHRALLSASLTKRLGHLVRKTCEGCGHSVI